MWVVFANSLVLVCVSLQEVNATPVRFISDLLVEDSWSHVFMDTLAPRGFVKVRQGRGRGNKKQQGVDEYKERLCTETAAVNHGVLKALFTFTQSLNGIVRIQLNSNHT